MKILFLSLLYEREKENYYKQKLGDSMPNASNTFQYALLDGIKENNRLEDVEIINSLPVGVYNKQYDELFLKEEDFVYDNEIIGKTLPCINYHIIKQRTRYKNTYNALKKYVLTHQNEQIMIITYNVYYPYIKACQKIVKKYNNVKFCPIITDMPGEFGMIPKVWWKKKYVLWIGKQTIKRLHYADRFVFLTEYMKNPLNVDKNYMIMEGIYSNIDKANMVNEVVEHNKKVILYTGSLNIRYGILNLIDAVLKIDRDDIELWICGGSGDIDNVKKLAEENDCIKFFGDVKRIDALKYQRSADLLVNPRPNNEVFVKYSFPSKTMEYLSSGKPVLMHKLDGIPNEYDLYLNYFTTNDAEDMAKDIQDILYGDYDKYLAKAKKGKQFIEEYKNSKVQVKRMLDFIEEKFDENCSN